MFAGPNGSGKSTLKNVLRSALLGVYLNADDMERELKLHSELRLADYGITTTDFESHEFFKRSPFLADEGMTAAAESVTVESGFLRIDRALVNSYLASVVADFFREHLLASRSSFTLETVMSHPGKVELLKKAQQLGYRTYLYFIATEDPEINISRVNARVLRGGHSVPKDKIVKRYHASIGQLTEALRHTNRAYIFDNSGEETERSWIAEITDGRELEMKTDKIPSWFKSSVWEAFSNGSTGSER